MKMSVLSTQFFSVPISSILDGQQHDPTSDSVQFAFTSGRSQEPSTWYNGVWDTGSDGPYYTAKILVGPVGVVLAKGTYTGWVKITDSPEVPVLRVGTLEIQTP